MIYQFKAEKTDAKLNFDINLDKDKSVYCFIGENGVGKTNLLENMGKALLWSHSMFCGRKNIDKFANLYHLEPIYEEIGKLKLYLPTDLIVNDNVLKSQIEEWDHISLEDIRYYTSPFVCDKPCVFIGTQTRGYTNNIDPNHIKILGSIEQRFIEAFSRSFNYISGKPMGNTAIADWFISRLIVNPRYISKSQNRDFEVEIILELIQQLEPSLQDLMVKNGDGYDLNIRYNAEEAKLYFNDSPLDKLSTGFVSIIKIFQEIVAGYGGWTGFQNERDLGNVEGVVFIDEIEAHLHPKWQHKFIPLLKKFFPKTTFYIATHSPIIVSTTEEGEAYELIREGDDVTAKRLGNPREWYFADLLSQGFHIDFDHSDDASNGAMNGTLSLLDKLKLFSTMVKEYTTQQDDGLRTKIDDLYQEILPSLGDDDPRRRSVDSLMGLVR